MKTVVRTSSFRLISSIGLGVVLLNAISVMADTTLFFDDFNGPTLNPAWQASLPNANIAYPIFGNPQSATYLGAPNYSFKHWEDIPSCT